MQQQQNKETILLNGSAETRFETDETETGTSASDIRHAVSFPSLFSLAVCSLLFFQKLHHLLKGIDNVRVNTWPRRLAARKKTQLCRPAGREQKKKESQLVVINCSTCLTRVVGECRGQDCSWGIGMRRDKDGER